MISSLWNLFYCCMIYVRYLLILHCYHTVCATNPCSFNVRKERLKFAAYVMKLSTLHLFYHQIINASHMNVPIEIIAWCTKKKNIGICVSITFELYNMELSSEEVQNMQVET
jgi:hypothetical protein